MIAAGLPQRVFPVIRNLKHCFINLWSFRVQQWLYRLFDLGVAICRQHSGIGNRHSLCVVFAAMPVCDSGIPRETDTSV